MSAPQSTAKRRSAVTGWLPYLDHGSRLIWIGFAAALIAAAIVVWSAFKNASNFAQPSIFPKPIRLSPSLKCLMAQLRGNRPFAGQPNVPEAAAPRAQNESGHDDNLEVEGFDLSTIRELRSLSDVATEDVFLELVATYRSELSASVAALESAVVSRDVEAIRKLAHALKCSSLTLGAAGFGALCESVQKSAQRSQIEKTQIEETIVRTRELIAHAANLPAQLQNAGAAATL